MKGGVIRATLDAAGGTYKGLKTDRELRHRLRQHKSQYKAHLISAMISVATEIVPQYEMQQQQMQKYLASMLSDHRNTVGEVLLDLMRQTGAQTTRGDEKKLLKRLQKRMVAMLPAAPEPTQPSFYKAVAEGDGLFRIDTNNDGKHDTFVRVVSPPAQLEGRWGSTLKKRRLGAMKEEQLDVSAVLSSKDRQIQQLQKKIQKLETTSPRPGPPLDIDLSKLPPPIFPLNSPAVQFAQTSTPLPLPVPMGVPRRPPSPRWQALERDQLYDLALINMLKSLGFGTDKKYWKNVTTDMISRWESRSGIPLKPGVKIKFLDTFGKPWCNGQAVEVLTNGRWCTGHIGQATDANITIMTSSRFSPAEIVEVPRHESNDRIREPTRMTAERDKYEKLIQELRRRAGCSSGDESLGPDSSAETDRAMSRSPTNPNEAATDTVKEEPADREFEWHSLKDLQLGSKWSPTSSFQGNLQDWPYESPWISDLGLGGQMPCLPKIDTDAPWDSNPAQGGGGRMPAIGTYLQSGPNALRNVLPLIPKFRGPKKPANVQQIPEPPGWA